MKILKHLFSSPHFWVRFVPVTLFIFALETFLLGLWKIPIINYSVLYMEKVTDFDMAFAVFFAVVFGLAVSLFWLAKRFNTASCSFSTVSGLGAFFTLLCPVCPIFFLTYFGLSASLLAISPYFWWIRGVSILLLFSGLILMVRRYELKKFPKFDTASFFHFSATVVILALFFSSQAMALELGQKMIASDPSSPVELSGDFSRDISALVTPTGLPFYGQALGLDFSSEDAINASIKKMAVLAPKQGSNPLILNDEEMKRYIAIGTEPTVACEFCCGVKTLVREDGSPTCGCAHSIAMRGTVAYLIRNYPEMTNAEIAYELLRQKGLYFPQQMQKRMAEEFAGEVKDFTPDIKYLTQNLSENEVRDLQRKARAEGFDPSKNASGMVGGC